MFRNLKALIAALLALAAIGAVSASGADAAFEFHCSVEPCRFTAKPDGTGKASHHVFIIENSLTTESVSFTCPEITGEGSSAKNASTATLENIKYPSTEKSGCTVNGSPGVEVKMNGCKYKLSSSGSVSIVGCNLGEKIEIKVAPLGCVFFVREQLAVNSAFFHTAGGAPLREVTVETGGLSAHLTVSVTTNGLCGSLITSSTLTGTYTTGNTLFTGETTAGVMGEAWWE